MATKDAMIRARVESELKIQVERIFKDLGLTPTEAITLFYYQVKMNEGLPFPVKIPNKETQKAMRGSERGINLVHCDSKEDMWNKLGI